MSMDAAIEMGIDPEEYFHPQDFPTPSDLSTPAGPAAPAAPAATAAPAAPPAPAAPAAPAAPPAPAAAVPPAALIPTPMKPLLIAVGPSQSGKSTTIGFCVPNGEPKPVVGDGTGSSTTTKPKVYRTIFDFDLLDCPGQDDSKLRFTGEECGKRVFEALSKFKRKTEDVNPKCIFLLFNSLNDGTNRLRTTLEWLENSFGKGSRDAAVVVATKADVLGFICTPDEKERKLEAFRKEARDLLGHDRYLVWQNRKGPDLLQPDDPVMKQQLEDLQRTLADVTAVPIDALEKLQTRIEALAKKLCDGHLSRNNDTVTPDRAREVPDETVTNFANTAGEAALGIMKEAFEIGYLGLGTAYHTAQLAVAVSEIGVAIPALAPAALPAMAVVGAVGASTGVLVIACYIYEKHFQPVQDTVTETVPVEVLREAESYWSEARAQILEEERRSLEVRT